MYNMHIVQVQLLIRSILRGEKISGEYICVQVFSRTANNTDAAATKSNAIYYLLAVWVDGILKTGQERIQRIVKTKIQW